MGIFLAGIVAFGVRRFFCCPKIPFPWNDVYSCYFLLRSKVCTYFYVYTIIFRELLETPAGSSLKE